MQGKSKAEIIIAKLKLEEHIEGGYFKQIYKSGEKVGDRSLVTIIYFLLTQDKPVATWAMNKSDMVHLHIQGGRFRYYIIHPKDGRLEEAVLSGEIQLGQSSHILVPGNTWYISYLQDGQYGLRSEVVAPGFEYQDLIISTPLKMSQTFPKYTKIIQQIELKRNKAK